jgi:hypothetical protein
MNKKLLQASPYARVKVLPYPIHYNSRGEEMPLRNDVWMMLARDEAVNIQCPFGMWTVDLGYDFIDGYPQLRIV